MSDPRLDALEALLTRDPEFVAAMQALGLGTRGEAVVPKLLRSNRPFEQLGQEHYPCWVVDAGDATPEDGGNAGGGDMAGLSVGSCSQDWVEDYDLAIVWVNQDFTASLAQRQAIKTALVRLLLRHPSLDDSASLAYIASAANDSNQRHPTHFSVFVLRAHHTISRD